MSNLELNHERSLINLCLDLVELDPHAPENKELIEQKINSLGTKVESYVGLNNFAKSQVEKLKAEIEYLDRQVKSFERVINSLRDKALFAMQTMDVKEIKGTNGHKLYIRKSESIQIDDVTMLPDWAVTKTVSIDANKTKIKEAIKEGELIAGARLVVKDSAVIK